MNQKKEKALIGLKKASSLLERVRKMTEKDDYCIDIMQQNLAVIGLLKSVHQNLMENHLESCFANAMANADEETRRKMTEEILRVSKLLNR